MLDIADVKRVESALSEEGLGNLLNTFSLSHFQKLYKDKFPFYKTTFWYPLSDTANNPFEKAIDQLAEHVKPDNSIIGVEWWFSVMRINKTPQWLLPCHFDRADIEESDPAKIQQPTIGSLLFLNTVPYGDLVLTDQKFTDRGARPRQPKNMVFTQPSQNRYVVFPGEAYHGVIGRMWRDEQPDEMRISMAVNWWTQKPGAQYMRSSSECMSAFELSV